MSNNYVYQHTKAPQDLMDEVLSHSYRVLRERGHETPPFGPNNDLNGLRYEDEKIMLNVHYMGGHTVSCSWADKEFHTFPIEELLNVWVKDEPNPWGHEGFAVFGAKDKKDRNFSRYEPYQIAAQRVVLAHLRSLSVLDHFVDQVFTDV